MLFSPNYSDQDLIAARELGLEPKEVTWPDGLKSTVFTSHNDDQLAWLYLRFFSDDLHSLDI